MGRKRDEWEKEGVVGWGSAKWRVLYSTTETNEPPHKASISESDTTE